MLPNHSTPTPILKLLPERLHFRLSDRWQGIHLSGLSKGNDDGNHGETSSCPQDMYNKVCYFLLPSQNSYCRNSAPGRLYLLEPLPHHPNRGNMTKHPTQVQKGEGSLCHPTGMLHLCLYHHHLNSDPSGLLYLSSITRLTEPGLIAHPQDSVQTCPHSAGSQSVATCPHIVGSQSIFPPLPG